MTELTEELEATVSPPGVDVEALSTAVFGILVERTRSVIFDKRRNVRTGRGFEFWCISKGDFWDHR